MCKHDIPVLGGEMTHRGKKNPQSCAADVAQLRAVEDQLLSRLRQQGLESLLEKGARGHVEPAIEMKDRNFSSQGQGYFHELTITKARKKSLGKSGHVHVEQESF